MRRDYLILLGNRSTEFWSMEKQTGALRWLPGAVVDQAPDLNMGPSQRTSRIAKPGFSAL
jgi:hypothetical protein